VICKAKKRLFFYLSNFIHLFLYTPIKKAAPDYSDAANISSNFRRAKSPEI